MKAKHRHELKTNELAQWIADFPNWAKENLRTIIYISVVLVLAMGAYAWKAYQKNIVTRGQRQRFMQLMAELTQGRMQIARLQADGTDYSYVLLQIANRLQNLARTTRNVNMAALALIKRAEALRSELHYRMGPVDQQNKKSQIAQAKAAYEEAASKTQASPVLRALAEFGLGLCAEELGEFDQARQIYTQVAHDPNFAATTAAASAEYRLEIMDDYRQELIFKEPVRPASPTPSSMEAPLPAVNLPTIEPISAVPNEPAGE